MKRIVPKNWNTFQHYKDRSPPWIKLHKQMLDDYDFQTLPDASRALAPMLWLLASEFENGEIPADARKVAFRVHKTLQELSDAFEPLLRAGFFRIIGEDEVIASAPLALCSLQTLPEKETQGTSLEEKEDSSDLQSDPSGTASKKAPKPKAVKTAYSSEFEEFWKVYPTDKNMSKLMAFKQWVKLSVEDQRAAIAGVLPYKAWISKQKDYRTLHAERFLSQRRFDGFKPAEIIDAEAALAAKDRADKLLRRGKYAEENAA